MLALSKIDQAGKKKKIHNNLGGGYLTESQGKERNE